MTNIKHFIPLQVGLQLVKMLAEEGYRVFSIQDAKLVAHMLGIESSVKYLLLYLKKYGWIVPIRRGVHALSPAFLGSVPIHEFEIATCLTKKAVISHFSALQYYGFITPPHYQTVYATVPTQTLIPRVKPGKLFTFQEKEYRFIHSVKHRLFGHTSFKVGKNKIEITDPERSLLDGLMNPQYCGGFEMVLKAFSADTPKVDFQKLISYSLKLHIAISKRLGWVLEKMGVSRSYLLILELRPIKDFVQLDVSGKRQGTYNRRWKIIENI